jgi:hypothetical protein
VTVGAVPRTRRRSAFDVELNGIGLKLVDAIDVRQDPGHEATADAEYGPFPRGMGYSEEYVPGTYSWGEGVCTRFGPVVPGGKVTEVDVSAFVGDLYPFRSSHVWGNDLLFFGGRNVIKIPNGTGAPALYYDMGLGVACGGNAACDFDGDMVWGSVVGATDAAWKMHKANTANTVTAYDGGGGRADIPCRACVDVRWDTDGQDAQRLVYMPSRSTFRTVAAPADPGVFPGNHSAAVTIGNGNHPVNSIAASAAHVYFICLDGVYDVDSRGGSHNFTPFWKQAWSLVNGVTSQIHEGDLFTVWNRGLLRVGLSGAREDTPEFCQPGADQPNGSPVFGFSNALAVDSGWLVDALYNPTLDKSYICYGKDKRILGIDAIGPLVWHGAEAVIPGLITYMRVHSATTGSPMLWVGAVVSGVPKLYKISLPSYGTPLQDLLHGGPHQFANSGSLYVLGGWEQSAKSRVVPTRYRTRARRLDGVAKVEVYRSNDSGAYARRAIALSSPYTTSIDTTRESATRVDFRFDLTGGDSNPPVLDTVSIEAAIQREQSDVQRITVEIEQPQITARGTRQRRSIRSVVNALKRIYNVTGTPVNYIDEDGQLHVVQMLSSPLARKTRTREARWRVLMEIDLLKLWSPWKWGDGTLWGEGKFFGGGN